MLSIEEMRDKIEKYCYGHDCSNCMLDPNKHCYTNATDEEIIANYTILNNTEGLDKNKGCNEKKDEIQANIHLNGYIFDSLMYRYQLARERQLMYEIVKKGIEPKTARDGFNRDLMRFGQILDEVIGEHD